VVNRASYDLIVPNSKPGLPYRVVKLATDMFAPGSDVARIMVESVARLLISHAVLPVKTPEAAGRDLARVACRYLGFTDPGNNVRQPSQKGKRVPPLPA
jgi:hypothetical protein